MEQVGRKIQFQPASLGLVAFALSLVSGCEISGVPGPGAAETVFAEDRPGLSVTVRDGDGAPVAGAYVALSPGVREAQTDASGLARFEALGAGTWTAAVTAQGYGAGAGEATLSDGEGELTVTLDAEAPASTTLGGAVSDPSGLPVEGAQIWVGEVAVATTDAAGNFEATGLSGGALVVRIEAPEGSGLLDWDIPALTLAEGARGEIAVALAGAPPDGARFVGSESCLVCHADALSAFSATAHAGAGRETDEAEADADLSGLADAFIGGSTVDLDDLGASLTLSRDGDGLWRAQITDAWGDSTDAMEVVEVYGGHRTGAALAVNAGDTEAVLPLVWALAGQGLSSKQAAAGWVSAYTEGWFDSDGHLSVDGAGRPSAEASFALQCAGCHATGGALSESGGHYAMDPSPVASAVEHRVGCESCHGPGSAHATSTSPSEIVNPSRLPTAQRVEVCARCHERSAPTDHPFTDTPAFPVADDGALLGPADLPGDFATAAPERWIEAPASKVGWDQVGDLRISPHLSGDQGYDAACEDCHDAHGSAHAASLRADPWDNTLCTGCHASDFPDESAEASHTHHNTFHPGAWSPGSCTGCHMPRMGLSVRPDAVSGAGELRTHSLDFIEPAASLAEFDAVGATVLDLGAAPVPACLDCHLQADAQAEDEDDNCPCPVGSAKKRVTYEDFQTAYEFVWGIE